MSIRSRFWAKVDKRGPDECWPWKGSFTGLGYGQLKIRGKRWGAHRVSWRLAHGPIPKGSCVCHHCDNPPCVNPAHLFIGTHKDNSQDMVAKGRHYHPSSMSLHQVRLLRVLYHTGLYTQAELACRFSLAQPTISAVTRGLLYAYAGGPTSQRRSLSHAEAAALRQRVSQGEKQITLAKEFGVSKSAVSLIVRGLRH